MPGSCHPRVSRLRFRWCEPCWPCGGVVGNHAAEAGVGQLCTGQVSAEKYRPVQVGSDQVSSAEVSTRQVGPAQQGVGQGGPA